VVALSWMFRHSKIPWQLLLHMSVRAILITFGITDGILLTDDSRKQRAKSAKKIAGIDRINDKSTGGFFMGQCIVFFVLVTPRITVSVGFAFHVPDPELGKWYKKNVKLKKNEALHRATVCPSRKEIQHIPQYPEVSLALREEFRAWHPDIRIRTIIADALYATSEFMDGASEIYGRVQVISHNQIMVSRAASAR
jgi:hypothetical protein